ENRIVFEPRAEVDHRVSDDRVEWAYLRRRSWAEGLSKAAVSKLVGSDDALSTERGYVAKVLPAAFGRELRKGRLASATAVVTALTWTTAGYLRGKLPGATSGVRLPAAEAAARPVPAQPVPAHPGSAHPGASAVGQRAAHPGPAPAHPGPAAAHIDGPTERLPTDGPTERLPAAGGARPAAAEQAPGRPRSGV
ncbi:MAG TPA: hypothetical protein VD813_12650, partial [Pseudonocardia sp.]|nr:hypothetical protein [Pseudonocardia sp.]